MPIRFYCPFCNQLLGIATRKAGARIECPRCHGEVGVPPEPAVSEPAPAHTPPAFDVELVPAPTSPDIILSANQVALLFLCVLILLGLAFLAGLIVGALRGA